MNPRKLIEADFVVIGGGSAGCVLAARLSEDPRNLVLLVEAGGDGRDWRIDLPVGPFLMMGRKRFDWAYRAEPDDSLGGRSISWPAGRMLGGGSAINGQIYVRGTRGDFDGWAAQGCAGWSFDEVLPYFRKAERYEGPTPPASHGTDGPLSVSPPRWTDPLLARFIEGFSQLGLPILNDYCGGDQFGVCAALATHRQGRRCSAARAYVDPVRHRSNLKILTESFVRRLLVADGRVTGVELSRNGVVSTVGVRAEAIVAAGAIGSPALLLRSGIGPGAELSRVNVATLLDLPGVGRNLQEHPAVMMARVVNVPTINSQARTLHGIAMGLEYLFHRRGPLTALSAPGIAFAKTRVDLAEPDVQFHFTPALFCFDVNGKAAMERRPGVQISANVCRPHSRGCIRLRDPAPESRPIIEFQAFGDHRDLETLVAGCKLGDRVFDTPAFKPAVVERYEPSRTPRSDREWQEFIRRKGQYFYHPAGTCRMGTGPDAVVDPSLRVRGIRGLRVADASIMPSLVSANTNAASIMIGEKAADLIRTSGPR